MEDLLADSVARRFVLVDRDGTLNEERDYVSDPEQLHLIAGAATALRRLQDAGFGIVVVTNQSGLARGYFTQKQLDAVHARLQEHLRGAGVTLDGLYVCPHGPADGCFCRKPLTGLVQQAVADLGFNPVESFVIGDKAVDLDLGHAVGAVPILVRTGYGRETELRIRPGQAAFIADSLADAADWVLSRFASCG